MPIHFQREIEKLKKDILTVGAMAELSVREATLAIQSRDETLAQGVIEKDLKLDQMEVDVEENCLKLLALYQPVAVDLRFIVAALKINNDLERVGDLAVNIAERAIYLASVPQVDISFDFMDMSGKVQSMLKNSLDALVNFNAPGARAVCGQDDVVDALNREMYMLVPPAIVAHPEQAEALIHMLSISRHLERIADHATNIAEDVIYMIEGEVVRHRVEEYRDDHPGEDELDT
ncbi:phosphate signaling complex protein PhoU [Planctomycetota bacterium]